MSDSQTSVTQEDIKIIKNDIYKLATVVNEIHTSIVGSKLSKDGGLVQRIIDIESEATILNDRILAVEKKRIKADLYLRIIWGFGGATLLALFIWILNTIKN